SSEVICWQVRQRLFVTNCLQSGSQFKKAEAGLFLFSGKNMKRNKSNPFSFADPVKKLPIEGLKAMTIHGTIQND
ncbi:hypothetical protein, partial [Paenibacillus tyrfis]|uniref:hypothetical protein n=1 Tax=Paenibacillus tyrfis TaxID=1501230 RepID=UPI001C6FC865